MSNLFILPLIYIRILYTYIYDWYPGAQHEVNFDAASPGETPVRLCGWLDRVVLADLPVDRGGRPPSALGAHEGADRRAGRSRRVGVAADRRVTLASRTAQAVVLAPERIVGSHALCDLLVDRCLQLLIAVDPELGLHAQVCLVAGDAALEEIELATSCREVDEVSCVVGDPSAVCVGLTGQVQTLSLTLLDAILVGVELGGLSGVAGGVGCDAVGVTGDLVPAHEGQDQDRQQRRNAEAEAQRREPPEGTVDTATILAVGAVDASDATLAAATTTATRTPGTVDTIGAIGAATSVVAQVVEPDVVDALCVSTSIARSDAVPEQSTLNTVDVAATVEVADDVVSAL